MSISPAEQDIEWLDSHLEHTTDDEHAVFIEQVGRILNDETETLESARQRALRWLLGRRCA